MKKFVTGSMLVLSLSLCGFSSNAMALDYVDFIIGPTAAPFISTTMPFAGWCDDGGPVCLVIVGISGAEAIMVTTTLALLKEVQAAQPDALEYAGGSAPSPFLYSVTEKLQEAVFEATGKEISFDDAVNTIIMVH